LAKFFIRQFICTKNLNTNVKDSFDPHSQNFRVIGSSNVQSITNDVSLDFAILCTWCDRFNPADIGTDSRIHAGCSISANLSVTNDAA